MTSKVYPRYVVAGLDQEDCFNIMDTSILLTKLFIPAVSAGLINRPDLLDRLTTGLEAGRGLILLSAPAGYGKSTLLAQWLAAYQGQVAWLSLDERDNNPLRFWGYVAKAFDTVAPTLGQAVQALLESDGVTDHQSLITTLVNAAAGLEQRILLVLDDYHVITEQAIHDGMNFLLEHLPRCLRIVIATRTDPPLPLSRMRVRGQLSEVRVADLRFTVHEAAKFLNELMKLGLAPADVQALDTRTEGWIAGLQLAALSMQGREDPHAFIMEFTGSQHFVLEYLVDEVLQRQPEVLQRFLLETSILQRMCPPLCDAVTGSAASAGILADLHRRNLFMIPLDGEYFWLRYHHLFAEFLKGHLKRLRAADLPDLHRRAAQWFQANDWPEDALQHALAIPDYAYVSRLVVDNWRRVYHAGRLDTAVKWLESLPGDLLRQSPALGVAYCWTLFIRGDYNRIDTYLGSIKASFERMVAAGDLPVEHPEYHLIMHQVILLRSIVLRHQGYGAEAIREIEQLLPSIEVVREALGEMYAHMGLTACYSQLGYAYAGLKDYDRAEEYLSRVSVHARDCGNYFSLAHATMEWAKISLLRGKTEQAENICRQELLLTGQAPYAGYPAFCLIQLELADALRTGGSFAEAGALLEKGLETAARSGHQYYLAQGYLIAAKLHHAQDEADYVREDLLRAEHIAATIHNRFLDEDIALVKQALGGDESRIQPLREPLSERELDVLRLICAGKSNQEIADELFIALDTVKRHANNLYGKLGVGRRTQAVVEARRLGLV
ncbi:MAG: LuxR C-terminal-related transcriptional regulator [Clostridia bacterium]|jgi:LuxR family maltose regulon positive regulatory protein